jgi:hypothetical protein
VSADRLLLGLLGCVMLKALFDYEIDKRQCAYCGGLNGHEQDCPHDFDQRGET